MTVQMRSNAGIIEIARDLMSAISPVTGVRGTGQIMVRPKGGAQVFLPRNWYLMPIVNGAVREDLLFKVDQGSNRAVYPDGKRKKANENEPDADSWWTIQPGGSMVNIVSLVGGRRFNLPKNTKFVFDPLNNDLETEAILQAPITNGSDPVHFGGCKSVVQFEQLNAPSASLDAFRASVGKLPAVVIVWDGSEPADGTTQSSIDRGRTRVGQTSQLFKERFNLFVLVERLDSSAVRSSEGLKLLEDITNWLTDLQSVDGEVFSSPTGIQIRGRSRIAGDNAAYQSMFIYALQISVTSCIRPYDSRTFSPWLRTNVDILTHRKDDEGNRKLVVSEDIDMTKTAEDVDTTDGSE